jgi:hypothetical protein
VVGGVGWMGGGLGGRGVGGGAPVKVTHNPDWLWTSFPCFLSLNPTVNCAAGEAQSANIPAPSPVCFLEIPKQNGVWTWSAARVPSLIAQYWSALEFIGLRPHDDATTVLPASEPTIWRQKPPLETAAGLVYGAMVMNEKFWLVAPAVQVLRVSGIAPESIPLPSTDAASSTSSRQLDNLIFITGDRIQWANSLISQALRKSNPWATLDYAYTPLLAEPGVRPLRPVARRGVISARVSLVRSPPRSARRDLGQGLCPY